MTACCALWPLLLQLLRVHVKPHGWHVTAQERFCAGLHVTAGELRFPQGQKSLLMVGETDFIPREERITEKPASVSWFLSGIHFTA